MSRGAEALGELNTHAPRRGLIDSPTGRKPEQALVRGSLNIGEQADTQDTREIKLRAAFRNTHSAPLTTLHRQLITDINKELIF